MTRAAAPHTSKVSVEQVACIAVLAVGAALRLFEYLANRALWLDESAVALDIVHDSYGRFLHPLNDGQAAPVGWFWLERSAVLLFGSSEWALRLAPFLLSLGSLVVFYLFVRRWLTGVSAALACTMFALSPELIRYAVEVKQYGSDVFFVLLVVVLATRFYDRQSTAAAILWAAGGLVAMWCSHAATITVVATSAVMLALELRRRGRLRVELLVSGLFAAFFAVEYVVNLRAISKSTRFERYWAAGIAPRPFGVRGTLRWLWHDSVHLAANPLQLGAPTLALVLVVLGLVLFVARRGPVAAFVVAPVLLSVAAAVLGKYPMRERLSLYLVPFLFVGLAALADRTRPLRPSPLAIAGALMVIAVAAPLGRGFAVVGSPIDVTNSRGPFAFVAARWKAGDSLVTERWATYSYRYYGPRYHLVRSGQFWFSRRGPGCASSIVLQPLLKSRRVWVIMTHHPMVEPPDRTEQFYSQFAQLGPQGATFHGTGDSSASVFDVVRRRVPPRVVPVGASECLGIRLSTPRHP